MNHPGIRLSYINNYWSHITTMKRLMLTITLVFAFASLWAAATATEWADSIMSSLTPRQRIAQLFIPRLDIADNVAGRAQLKKIVDAGMGGILLGKGTPESYASLNNYAQSESDVPMLITLDGEWGPAMRVSNTVRFPYNMGLGAIQDINLIEEFGREVARECKELGIQVDFAPDADVNSNPNNPIIGYRSFGENPERVAQMTSSFAKGLQQGGVMAVAKHFPGHGDTSVDSHKALPTVDHSVETLKNIDLIPFKAAINNGIDGIMVGHLNVPALDASGKPASLSKKITTDLLKDEMGFSGLVFTDALAMKGAVSGSENNCVAALKAGADIILQPASPIADLNAVEEAVKNGTLSQNAIDRSVKKLLEAKFKYGLSNQKPVKTEGLRERLNSNAALDMNRKLAEASITAVRNDAGLLPLRDLGKIKIGSVNLGDKKATTFDTYCDKYASVVNYSSVTPELMKSDIIIVTVTSDGAETRNTFHRLASEAGKKIVAVFFINPYKMAKFANGLKFVSTLLTAYDFTSALEKAAAEGIFGGIKIDGRMPVNVPGIAKLGQGVILKKVRLGFDKDLVLEQRIDSVINAAISAKAMPGCQVVVGRKGNIILDKAYGTLSFNSPEKVTNSTLYDVASMTKATATLAGIMKAYDEGLFQLDDKASTYIPGLQNTDKENITIRQLLLHESGLPSGLATTSLIMDTLSYDKPLMKRKKVAPYTIEIEKGWYGNHNAKLRKDITSPVQTTDFDIEAAKGFFVGRSTLDTLRQRIYNAKLGPQRYKYSDLNFCLLQEIEENTTGVDLDQWVDSEIFQPLGATRTGFRPREWYPVEKIAPTEMDNFVRKQHLRGYVHDETAAFSGGISGNAGLFSTAEDIAKYCQMLLNGGSYGGEQIISPQTVKTFMTTTNRNGNRSLGFDKQPEGSPASSATVGHNGFTGTCFWVDPETDTFIVFLSNRVNPSRSNAVFSKLKPRTGVIEQVYRD